MATHYIPRNVKGEGRILYVFYNEEINRGRVSAAYMFAVIHKAAQK